MVPDYKQHSLELLPGMEVRSFVLEEECANMAAT